MHQYLLFEPENNTPNIKKNIFDFKEQPLKELFNINRHFFGNSNIFNSQSQNQPSKNPFYDNEPLKNLQQ